MATVKKATIHGIDVTIEVDSNGSFYAHVDDVGQFHGKTLAELEEQLNKSLKRATAKKAIEVTVLGLRPKQKGDFGSYNSNFTKGDGAVDVTLRGFSDRTRDLLITEPDGKTKGKLGANDAQDVVKKLTPAEHAEYAQLLENVALARRALEAFAAPRRFDWREYFEVGR